MTGLFRHRRPISFHWGVRDWKRRSILAFLVSASITAIQPAASQDLQEGPPSDTTLSAERIFHLPSLFYILTMTPGRMNDEATGSLHGSLRQEFGLMSPYDSWSYTETIDLDSPWKVHLARQKEHSAMYSILGSVQVGGAAYILYRHIKKYGLK